MCVYVCMCVRVGRWLWTLYIHGTVNSFLPFRPLQTSHTHTHTHRQDPGLCQWNYHANLYEKAVKIAANWYSILYEIGRFWRKYYAKFYIA